MKMYLATPYFSPQITATDVDRATASSVWIRHRRRTRISDTAGYFDSWKAAYDWLIERALETVEGRKKALTSAKENLAVSREMLEYIQAMKEPDPCTP